MDKNELDLFEKQEKMEMLRTHGWCELLRKDNWIDCANPPKKWVGYKFEDAFEKFAKNNKKTIKQFLKKNGRNN